VLLVMSTTGDGEEPDNMRASWRFLLRRSLPASSLARTRFALFGLGDSSYPKFNAVARRMQVRERANGQATHKPHLFGTWVSWLHVVGAPRGQAKRACDHDARVHKGVGHASHETCIPAADEAEAARGAKLRADG
jgi:hypothetical protein